MMFDTLTYFLFLPAVFLLFYFCRDRYRWLALLLASLSFYATFKAPYLLVVLGLVAVVTYAVGRRLGRCSDEAVRKRLLWLGVGADLLILAAMKYLPSLLSAFTGHQSPVTGHLLIISIGVSYYVFQAISYLADIYLEIIEPELHFGYLFLSLAFFPKLLQGPIERTGDLLPQLKKPYEFDYDNMRSGMLMFAWGLFKKLVVADRLALFVNVVYGDVHAYTGLPLILATWFYAFQIYFDFSGYTDMALGTARMFNIRLTQNFNSPYLATSVADFWRRWHISFSRWILDYIFKPLQMQWRYWRTTGTALALMITFLASGVWHGARWGFVVWGLLHGIYLAASVYYRPLQKNIHRALGLEKSRLLKVWQAFITFNLVCFAWIFFRANSLDDAVYVTTHLTTGIGHTLANLTNGDVIFTQILMGQKEWEFALDSGFLAGIFLFDAFKKDEEFTVAIFSKPFLWRWATYYTLILAIILFGVHESSQFIYFRF